MLLTRRCREIALCGSPVIVAKPEVQRVLLVVLQGWAHHVLEHHFNAIILFYIVHKAQYRAVSWQSKLYIVDLRLAFFKGSNTK